jgi:DNA helicase-2/ATP-dependent DNA helicase PcrA
VFIRVGMPYKVVGGVRFYERKEVRDALAYLKLVANPADVVSLRRVINVPKRGIGEKAESCIESFADRERIAFASALRRCSEVNTLAPRRSRRSRSSSRCWRSSSSWWRPGRVRPRCWRASSTAPATSPSCRPAPTRRTRGRVDNLNELISVAAEFEAANPGGSVTDFLEQVSLVADADQIPVAGDDAGVSR